ncbi:phenylalanine--tRNA ligase subunit beta [Brevibacterium sp. 50QC2O2]|uniref:phenylalanine--tRNA ligase subunit beta n=1 Tax=unclassified Brevibacterium TaxID=2614124 RepID=UPI00211BB29D|nr:MULTISPECIES: phenylalanine--tRNA ligase subunit beta [unclassified Brevibacterium]MCQ9369316.1 phenylalanine--tRNA ligase subunit beta [Brevibacterium sp. 91QC2O2]MCQ9387929.1 phenylalanine--tRNA ligase subunit beta [Brevibacterium sp. 50QC2O2]
MRVSLEWLSELVDLSGVTDARELAAELAGIGLEEEDFFGPTVTGPLVVARVLTAEPEKHSNGKTVNWCSVDVGEDEPRGIVCGAHNFGPGDLVVACLPGAVLPGDFAIAARKTYGHVSDGMICSARELGLGEDHDGIIRLADWGLDGTPGDDAKALLGLDNTVLDVNITPDRGYQLSLRGVAREFALLKNQEFADPAALDTSDLLAAAGTGFPVELADEAPIHGVPGCDRLTALRVTGIDASARTPYWMVKRLLDEGMRPISLTVDVTNYVMLELGQPLHAYDTAKLGDKLVVRRARKGEKLTTLDDVKRKLDPEDLLITDEGGAAGDTRIIGLAGVMGGAALQVTEQTTDILIEAAHFDAVSIARTARRHKLPSEAARRFERGVDPFLGPTAALRCALLLVELGGGTLSHDVTVAGSAPSEAVLDFAVDAAAKRVGVAYTPAQVVSALESVGCRVDGVAEAAQPGALLRVTVPGWRPDLSASEDLVEEVVRVNGYDQVPSILPQAPGGAGLTRAQRTRRAVSNLLAAAGLTEVLTYPFTSDKRSDAELIDAADPRRVNIRLANPLAEDNPLMRTHLLATLPDALARNLGRGFKDVALFEAGLVTTPQTTALAQGLSFQPGYHPDDAELEAIFASVPAQPYHFAGIISGHAELPGVWGKGRQAGAQDVIELVHRIAALIGVRPEVAAAEYAPYHPGRCARFTGATGAVLGHAGELHPKVCENLGLPARTVAFEIDLDALLAQPTARDWHGALSSYPVSRQDVALLVDDTVTVGQLAAALRAGAGDELESLELFDVYTGDQIAQGKKSVAFRLTFRAHDRTLTADEASALREAATAVAAQRHGAEVRG